MENISIKVKTNKFIDREKALEILQNETGEFESTSRLREDIIDAMIDFAQQVPKQETLYTKEDVLKAGEIGEINHYDYKHIASLLDEAKAINQSLEQPKKD